jgi:hypothetical protein
MLKAIQKMMVTNMMEKLMMLVMNFIRYKNMLKIADPELASLEGL